MQNLHNTFFLSLHAKMHVIGQLKFFLFLNLCIFCTCDTLVKFPFLETVVDVSC